mgnify:CR=1 FL=1
MAQKATHAIRRDLFAKMQDLPLSHFDTHTHGELRSWKPALALASWLKTLMTF